MSRRDALVQNLEVYSILGITSCLDSLVLNMKIYSILGITGIFLQKFGDCTIILGMTGMKVCQSSKKLVCDVGCNSEMLSLLNKTRIATYCCGMLCMSLCKSMDVLYCLHYKQD